MQQAPPPTSLRSAVRRALALAAPGRRASSRRWRGALAVLAWGLAGAVATAQPPFQMEVIPGFSSLVVDIRSQPVLADLDGDGDLDLVAGEERGTLRYFENTGSPVLAVFVERTAAANPFHGFDAGARSKVDFGDLDGDGDLDALVGEEGGTLLYLENTGSPAAPAFVERGGAGNPLLGVDVGVASDPELGDLDGDADLDLVIGESAGGFAYLENVGSALLPVFMQRTGSANPLAGLDLGSTNSPELGDLDGDLDLDLAVGEFLGIVFFLTNTGSTAAPAFVLQSGSANPFFGIDVGSWASPALGDLDGDADLDVVLGDSFGGLTYFRNSGSSTAPAFVALAGSANPINGADLGFNAQPALADLDGDSDLDVLVGQGNGQVSFFENTGSPVAPAFVRRNGAFNPLDDVDVGSNSSPELSDLDGDGDRDVAVGTADGTVRFFDNAGSASGAVFVELTGALSAFEGVDVGDAATPELADLDGDDDLDAIVGNLDGVVAFFENSGSSTAPLFVEVTGPGKPFAGVDLGTESHSELVDLDGDGDLDAVFGEAEGTLPFFHNLGTSTTPAFVERSGAANPFDGIDVGRDSAPLLADLDGDGDLDALIGESGGRLVFFRSLASLVAALPFADGFESGDTSAWSASVPP